MIADMRDHADDEQSGEVFGAPVAVGVAPGRARRANANAIHSGTAVRASEKLWMVSAARAIDPETTAMTTCTIAVAPVRAG